MTSALLRRTAAATASLALTLALTACGGSDDSDGPDGSDGSGDDTSARAVPSEDELTSALLTSDDVPADYVQAVPDEDSDDTIFDDTCLADVSDFSEQVGSEPASEAKTEFNLDSDTGQASISAGISAYDDEGAVTDAFGAFYDSLDGCTNVAFTDTQGIAYDIDVAIDDAVTIDGAASQLTITLSGSAVAGAQTLPLDFAFLVIRNGAETSQVGTSEIGAGDGINDQLETLAQTQADRLAELLG